MPITTKFVSLNSARGEVDSQQLYVIKFVNELRQVIGFFWVLWIPPPIKLALQFNWNIVESRIIYHNPMVPN